MITIVLPWIDSHLLPNRADGRKWQATITYKTEARMIGYCSAQQVADGIFIDPNIDHELSIIYHPAHNPGPDRDNFLKAMKPTLDGIAQALGIDDRKFNPVRITRADKVDGGRVTVIIDDLPF